MPSAAPQVSYEDLYARWERGRWRAAEIDFSEDRRQWHEVLTEHERRGRRGRRQHDQQALAPRR